MKWDILFFINSILLGFALTMDAFSVSVVNGIKEPHMSKKRSAGIAGVYAFFQAFMPMTGWLCTHKLIRTFRSVQKWMPLLSLILLVLLGGSMIWEGCHRKDVSVQAEHVSSGRILMQGVATSIDALSVGFVISSYNWEMAAVCSIIIAIVTFAVCIPGMWLGKKAGLKLSEKADIVGGIILICIGLEIFLKG